MRIGGLTFSSFLCYVAAVPRVGSQLHKEYNMSRLVAILVFAVIFAAFPNLASAQPDPDPQAVCLNACANQMQACDDSATAVVLNCANLTECAGVKFGENVIEAIENLCRKTCEVKDNCAGGLPTLKGGTPNAVPKTPTPSSPKPGAWTMPPSPELTCRSQGGAWVKTKDGLGYECMTLARLNSRVNELERQIGNLPKGTDNSAALAGMEKDLKETKDEIVRHLANLDGSVQSIAAGDADRSARVDNLYKIVLALQKRVEALKKQQSYDVFGFEIGFMANVEAVRPLDETHWGIGPKFGVHFRFTPDWDFRIAGGVGYAGKDLRGDALKYVMGELGFAYRVVDWFQLLVGADVIQRLNPPNASNSSTFGPLLALRFTPGEDVNRFLFEVNAGVKGTIFPIYTGTHLDSIHAIANFAVNGVIGYDYN